MLTLIALAAVSSVQNQGLKCPVTGEDVVAKSNLVEYAGARYAFCCPGCDSQFLKTPAKFLEARVKAGATSGVFLFDPVSHQRLDLKEAKATSDYKGVRYPFASTEDKAAFDKSPATFAQVPKMEALYCPVGKEAVPSMAKASDYADYDGVRYYLCCPGCMDPFQKDPKKYLDAKAKAYVHEVKAMAVKSD